VVSEWDDSFQFVQRNQFQWGAFSKTTPTLLCNYAI